MGRKVRMTIAFEPEEAEYIGLVAEYLGLELKKDGTVNASKAAREIVRYHMNHPANAKIKALMKNAND